MLMQMAFFTALASSLAEWIIYYNFPAYLRFTEGRSWIDLIVGSALSAGLARMFGGTGVVLVVAAGLSLVISWMGMPVVRYFAYNKHLIPEWKAKALMYAKNTWLVVMAIANIMLIIPRLIMKIYRGIMWVLNHPRFTKARGYMERLQDSPAAAGTN